MKKKSFDHDFHIFFYSEKDIKNINKFIKSVGHEEFSSISYETGYVRYKKSDNRFYYGSLNVMSEWVSPYSVLYKVAVKKKYYLKTN